VGLGDVTDDRGDPQFAWCRRFFEPPGLAGVLGQLDRVLALLLGKCDQVCADTDGRDRDRLRLRADTHNRRESSERGRAGYGRGPRVLRCCAGRPLVSQAHQQWGHQCQAGGQGRRGDDAATALTGKAPAAIAPLLHRFLLAFAIRLVLRVSRASATMPAVMMTNWASTLRAVLSGWPH